MAIPRLTVFSLLILAAAVCIPNVTRASGVFDDDPPPTLPYYLDRLPAKPPALIFQETFPGPATAARPVDFKAALLALAADCEKGQPPAALLASADKLLTQARLDPVQPAALCNVCNDVRDLFAAAPPVTGKPAAGYIRWRVEHAGWFHLGWDGKRPDDSSEDEKSASQRQEQELKTLEKLAGDPTQGPLTVHWLYLCGAYEFPGGGTARFQQVVDSFPDHPRAEAARFLLARGRIGASRSHGDSGDEPSQADAFAAAQDRARARTLFADYLKRYPQGRFAADVPGWLGALAFDEKDYLRALDFYVQQAEFPGHPEVLKSAGFMCERCLSRLTEEADNEAALREVAAHPRLAMSLIYLLVNTPEANNDDGQLDDPAQVTRWRRALLPRLAEAVVAHKDAYAGADWQARYLAILAQAASGTGDQNKALALCDLAKDELTRSDDLAFVRLVALGRARRLPETIAAGRDFARRFPKSPLAPGASLRLALALQDDHQAGAAVGELSRLHRAVAAVADSISKTDADGTDASGSVEYVYPTSDAGLSASRSVLNSDTSGAEAGELAQLTDTLLNFAPLPELAAALAPGGDNGLDGADAATLRAVLVQRWLAEEENFAEAKKYATPAQWNVTAAKLEKLAADAANTSTGEARAAAYGRLAEGWAGARGKLVFAPLETDTTRALYADEAERAGLHRRDNGLALGLPADRIDHALLSRDEWRHAFNWWLKTADAAPVKSPAEARALWSALRVLPSLTLATPYAFQRAGETDATGLSRRVYDRLRRDCPDSREAREFAVYYDLAPPLEKPEEEAGSGSDNDDKDKDAAKKPPEPNLAAALVGDPLPTNEQEYRWNPVDENGNLIEDDSPGGEEHDINEIAAQSLTLGEPEYTAHPPHLAQKVARLREQMRNVHRETGDLFLVNYLDDLSDFLQEPAAKLTPEAVSRYVGLRIECLSVEHWSQNSDVSLPEVPGASEGTLNDTVLAHIRAAYRAPGMAAFKDYLDFLALAVIANENIDVPVPGETQDNKDDESGKKVPATYSARDYPKLTKLTEGFLKDYPHSRKREAVRLLYARSLYAASRPRPREKFATWPESGHFAGGTMIVTHRQEPFEPQKIGAALNAYDHEFPDGRYAGEIRNLRGLLAWRTQAWPLALDLTLATLDDKTNPALQGEADRRLINIFMDGLTDETERARCLAAIKARPTAVEKLRDFLPHSPYPLQAMRSWVLAQL